MSVLKLQALACLTPSCVATFANSTKKEKECCLSVNAGCVLTAISHRCSGTGKVGGALIGIPQEEDAIAKQ